MGSGAARRETENSGQNPEFQGQRDALTVSWTIQGIPGRLATMHRGLIPANPRLLAAETITAVIPSPHVTYTGSRRIFFRHAFLLPRFLRRRPNSGVVHGMLAIVTFVASHPNILPRGYRLLALSSDGPHVCRVRVHLSRAASSWQSSERSTHEQAGKAFVLWTPTGSLSTALSLLGMTLRLKLHRQVRWTPPRRRRILLNFLS